MTVLRVEQRRGFALEATHTIDAMVCDKEGRVVASCGEDWLTTFRSAAKPFQLEAVLTALPAAQRALLSSEDLALGAASHHAEAMHVTRVESLLGRLGRRVDHLYCGAHAPAHGPSAEALFTRGQRPSALHNNCSGKHSFMAAATLALGAADDYRPAEHPLQQRILASLEARLGGAIAGTVTDGCGIPCFVLPLSAMARAYAQLAVATAAESQAGLGAIGRAMRQHPQLMSGSEAFDGWLAEHLSVVAKVGAGGLLCLALPEQGLGVAIKARSGADAVRPAATVALLERFFPGLLRSEVPAKFTRITNVAGAEVGGYVTSWE
jgi:L-asparaginase II